MRSPREPARLPALRVLAALALLLASLTACGAGGRTPVRILVAGDSVTQGAAGDYTWRFRLWQHLHASHVPVDLVGPWDGLFDPATGSLHSHAYADPHFDQDHAARWGAAFATEDPSIGALVRRYHPDVVVEAFGVNDLVALGETPAATLDDARTFVAAARAADPGVAVVLTELPQVWLPGVVEYDAGLTGLVQELSTYRSPVAVARVHQPFVEGVDTYDPAHPTTSGQVKIAAGVADALSGLGIGPPYPPTPS